jgi:hypothetical protein
MTHPKTRRTIMKNAKHLIQMTLAASMALSVFTACAPKAAGPVSPSNPTTGATTGTNVSTGTNTSTGATTGTNVSTGTSTGSTATAPIATTSTANSMQADLVALHEEEALYADSSAAASDSGFSIKVLGQDTTRGEISATNLGLARPVAVAAGAQAKARATVRLPLAKDKAMAAQQRAKAQLMVKKENVQALRTQFKASGAVTVNEDGSITIDPVKFKAEAKAAIQMKKEVFQARLDKVKGKLQATKALAQAKIEKLRRKNNTVRTSDVEKVTNDDGSMTETIKVEFENTRTGLKRTTYLARTTKDGKLMSVDFKLDASATNYTRTVNRTVTVNADGSRNVSIESITKWTNGRMREVNQERVVSADGSVTGTGTITITGADGKTMTRNLTLGITAAGDMTTACMDPETQTEVTIEEPAAASASTETTATVTVDVPATSDAAAESVASEVNLEVEAEAQAEANTGDAAAV